MGPGIRYLQYLQPARSQVRVSHDFKSIFYNYLKVLSHWIFKSIYDIKSVLSVWTLMILNFFYSGFILIFKDQVLMYIAQNAS